MLDRFPTPQMFAHVTKSEKYSVKNENDTTMFILLNQQDASCPAAGLLF